MRGNLPEPVGDITAAGRPARGEGGPALRPRRLLREALDVFARLWRPLLAVAAVVLAPCAVVSTGVLSTVLRQDGLIVNAELGIGGVSRPLAAMAAAMGLISLAATAAAVAACCLVAAGVPLNRPVTARDAVRRAVSRLPALALLMLLWLVWTALGVLAGLAVGSAVAWWLGGAVLLAVVAPALRYLVALPVVAVERRGALSALRRAHVLTRVRGSETAGVLLTAMAVLITLAAALAAGSGWLIRAADPPDSGIVGVAAVVLRDTVRWAGSLTALAAFAAVLTLAYVNGRRGHWPYGPTVDLAAARGLLPGREGVPAAARSADQRRLGAVVLAGLLLPPLIHGGMVAVNPFGFPVLTDHPVATSGSPDHVSLFVPGRGDPAVVLTTGVGADISRCTDATCRGSRALTGSHPGIRPYSALAKSAAGGGRSRLTLAAWVDGSIPGPDSVLRLFDCDERTCREAPVDALRTVADDNPTATAITESADGLLLVASTIEEQNDEHTLTLTTCADVRCTRHRSVRLAGVDFTPTIHGGRPLAVAADGSGRVVVAHAEPDEETVTLVTCPRPDCTERRVSVHRVDPDPPSVRSGGTEMRVDAAFVDGRPLVAYRTVTGAVGLLWCTRDDCASVRSVRLAGPGPGQHGPALAVDRAGRPVVAFTRPGARRLLVLRCPDAECRRPERSQLLRADRKVASLDLALDGNDRPVLAWLDADRDDTFGIGKVHFTTCRKPVCRSGQG